MDYFDIYHTQPPKPPTIPPSSENVAKRTAHLFWTRYFLDLQKGSWTLQLFPPVYICLPLGLDLQKHF